MIKAEIKDTELAEYLRELPDDDMIHFTMAEGRIRGAFFHGTHLVNQMRAQHGTGILESYILGQACLSAALLIPALMKGREHITWRYEVEGSPAKGFSVEADSAGWVRGTLLVPSIPLDKPLESWDITPFLSGEGIMTLQTVRPGDKYPQTSSISTTGSIADDLVTYFNRSEQLSTALTTSIQMDRQGRIIGAGGIFIQVMPETGGQYRGVQKRGADVDSSSDTGENEQLLESVENAYRQVPSLGTWFSRGQDCETLLSKAFSSFNPVVALHRSVVFDCPCSRELFLRHLRTLPLAEREDMKEHGEPLELSCQNCSSVYHIDVSEI